MQTLLTWSLGFYFLIYTFEGPVRYVLNLIGMDELIFVRDAVLLFPVLLLGMQQFLKHKLHPAFLIYAAVVLLHGTVSILNLGFPPAAIYGAKMLLTLLVGAVLAPLVLQPKKPFLIFIAVLWVSIVVGVMLDKYFVSFPWAGLTANIGDVPVDVSRNWDNTEGVDKRAAGFLRSSIHAASVAPLFALLLVFHLKQLLPRILIAFVTIAVLYWTTQKGALFAYVIVIVLLGFRPPRPIPTFRIGIFFFALLAIALPTILPLYYMPQSGSGNFSNMSFNMRVEMMWPQAWQWISQYGTFPFGVGLGGIGGAQVMYARGSVNAGDNLFVFLYAYFGLMSLVYLAIILWGVFLARREASGTTAYALSVLLFFFAYGCVLSMLEDQVISLFFGASLAWLAVEARRTLRGDKADTQSLADPPLPLLPKNPKVL